jgi:hypothetical protein
VLLKVLRCRAIRSLYDWQVPLSTDQSLIVVSARDLVTVADKLQTELGTFRNARIVSLVLDNNRATSLRGSLTVLAVVSHDA